MKSKTLMLACAILLGTLASTAMAQQPQERAQDLTVQELENQIRQLQLQLQGRQKGVLRGEDIRNAPVDNRTNTLSAPAGLMDDDAAGVLPAPPVNIPEPAMTRPSISNLDSLPNSYATDLNAPGSELEFAPGYQPGAEGSSTLLTAPAPDIVFGTPVAPQDYLLLTQPTIIVRPLPAYRAPYPMYIPTGSYRPSGYICPMSSGAYRTPYSNY